LSTNRKLISVSEQNYKKLKKLGIASESFNDVISRLLRNMQLDALVMDQVRGNEVR